MRGVRSVLALALLAAPFSGCTDSTSPLAVEAGAITPGKWMVNGHVDYLLLWAHNPAQKTVKVEWGLSFPQGAPSGLAFSFDPPTSNLASNGVKQPDPRTGGFTYPDWAWTRARVTVDPGAPAGVYEARIVAGDANETVQVIVSDSRTNVSGPGSSIKTFYRGLFKATGKEFQNGTFPLVLGAGGAIPGFDNGLMGMAVNESATLVLPPPLAYGYDQTGAEHTRFNAQWLVFDVKILSWDRGTAP